MVDGYRDSDFFSWIEANAKFYAPVIVNCLDREEASVILERHWGGVSSTPVVLKGCPSMLDYPKFEMKDIADHYGEYTTKWHFASSGGERLPHIANQRTSDKFLKVNEAFSRINSYLGKSHRGGANASTCAYRPTTDDLLVFTGISFDEVYYVD